MIDSRFGKKRLFEMMAKVSGMPELTETAGSFGQLPPGFSSNEFKSLESDIEDTPCSTELDEEMFSSLNTKEYDQSKIQTDYKKKFASYLNGDKQGIGKTGRVHSGTLKNIANFNNLKNKEGNPITPDEITGKNRKKFDVNPENVPDFDLNKLKKILMTKPSDKQLLGSNQKMAKSNFYNISLPALKSLIYNEQDGKFYVLIVCSNAKECVNWCYAQMGNYVLFDAPIRLKMQKLNYLVNHWEEWRDRIITKINSLVANQNEGDETVIRWHDSGDFISPHYLQIALDIARATPKAYHYAYTKEVSAVKGADIPSNFEFKYSLEGVERSKITVNDPRGLVAPNFLFNKYLKRKPDGVSEKEWKDNHGMWQFDDNEKEIIKKEIANYYKTNPNEIMWHDDYMKMPHDRSQTYERKWYVIGKPGDTDIPASRKDTMGIINLLHK